MRTELGVLDRVTLTAWRFVNEAGWTILAFVVATAAHLGLTIWLQNRLLVISDAFNINARAGAEEGFDDVIAKFGLRFALTIALAALIGGIVGRRVWRRWAVWAAVAAAAYVIYTVIWIEHSVSGSEVFIQMPGGAEQHFVRRTTFFPALMYDLVVAATVPTAVWVATRVIQRRRELPAVLAD